MMATVAVTSLLPAYNAKADESGLADGSKCTPTSYTLGDASGTAREDTGVATYVGRDLYIGKNTNGNTNISNDNDVDGSYAVEAEGLTVVNGKLVMKPLKDSWKAPDANGTYNSAGFRWGTVGFGSQFRPSDGKTVLAIGGANSGISSLFSGGIQGNVGAYGKGGFVGQSYTEWDKNKGYQPVAESAQGYKYKASIAGNETKWSTNTSRSSIVAAQGHWNNAANNDVTFNALEPLKDVNGTDYTDYTEAYLKSKLSEPLSKLQDTGTVNDSETAPEGTATRYKYNYDETKDPVSFQFTYNGGSTTVDTKSVRNNEKLITFTGDNQSATQVFSLTSEQLSSAGYRGVDFKFVNIPDNASIVINVSGDNIDFHTGWRFWWNNTDIGGGFSKAELEEVRKLYSSVAQKIMWNFKDAKNVTIRGGVANESNSEIDGNHQSKNTTDDPAAAMLGSILVPNGSFESHVSTNGRVYVGQDFMMYNPTAIAYENDKAGWEGKTASVLNMDQERHNLPWNGQMTSNCPAIQWNKANSAGDSLSGTTWKVYGTLEAAKAKTSFLGTITDGEFTDGNDVDGIIKFEGVAKNAKYFVKEFATNSTEYTKVNPYIYQINTGDDEDTHTNIVHVYDADGVEILGSNADKKLTDSSAIINEKEGAALEWSKVDGAADGKTLSGSEWQLQKNGSHKAYQITDSTKAVDKVTIQYNGDVVPTEGISLTYDVAVDLTAIVTGTDGGTDGVPQAVKWSSSDPTVASVNDGTVLGLKNGPATITACSVADDTKCATATITVTGAPADTKNSTTFYFKADGYTSGNTKLRYRLLPAEGNEGWSTGDTDPVLSNATNCSGWLSVMIDNPGLKAVEFLFYQGSSWYHSGGANSSMNFNLSAGQSAVAVQDYKAVNGAPSGCSAGGGSGSGGSTATGTVTITGDSVVSLGKTITLTATPTPSSDTVTWYSGNTSVASVAAGSGTTATVTGLKAGTTTITAKTSSGATASVTVTVKDDSKVGLYFKKSAVNSNWSAYYLHYQKTASYWPAVKMKDACNGDYVVAYIPKADAHKGYGFLFRDSTDIKTGNWYGANGANASGGNFTFWNDGVGMHIESNSDKGEGVPSGCQATQSAAKMKARVSTAVLRSDKIRTVAINESDGSNADASTTVYACGDAQGKCDMDTRAGYFKVIDLADGTYTLTETVAPNGYTAGGPYTVKIADGTVTITDALGNSIADSKIPNTRNTGAILWNKVSSDSQNDQKLGGSEWKLTKTADFSWNDGTVDSTKKGQAEYVTIDEALRQSWNVTDCKSGTGNTCFAPAEGWKIYDVDPVEGQFKLTGLEWGTYTLVETKAPDGYDVDSTVRTFTFGPTAGTDGTGTWKSNSVKSKTSDTTGAFTTSDVKYDSSVFTFSVNGIKNKPGVILPGTGGAGDYWIYAAALVAALIGVVAAGMALKVRRRQ